MALFRKLFYRKPPDRLLEISDRVYVFDCCFSSEHLEENEFKDYMNNILVQLQSYFPDASLTVFNFRDGEGRNLVAEILSRCNIGVIEYPHGYHGCPLLPLGMVYQFLRFCDNWLSSEGKQNVLLMHCEIGGWPVLSFMLACLMLYRSQYSGEERTLEMMYKQAPREVLQMFSPLNPFPSHVRYLHYITGKDNGLQWPLCDVPYSLDCLILQDAPYFDGKAGFSPIVRVYGRDPSNLVDESCQVLFTSLENKEKVHNSRQAGRAHITLDIHCNIQGDVVLECILMNEHLELEEMMFRIMFNTRFVQNNVLLLNSEEIDIIWGMEDQFPKNFKAEVIFSEFDVGSNTPKVTAMEKDEVEAEEFFEAEEIFSNPDLHDGTRDLDFNSTPIKVHDSILPELLSDHDDTANSSLEFDHTIHNLRNGRAQAKLILDDPTALSEMVKERRQVASHDYEAQRLDNENSDMIVETHIQDSPLVEDNAFITRNLRNFFQNAFNNILDDNKVICSTVSVNEAKGSLEIKLPKHNTETYDIGGQSFQDSSPEFRTPKMVDLSQHTKRIPLLADDGRSMSEINGLNLIEEVECLINPDIQMAFDGGALGHATCQSEILQADQPEVSCKNEERVKVEFPIGGSVHNGNSSEFGNFNVLYRNEDAKDNHYFETEEHISVSNGLEKALMRNKEIISRDMAQNFITPMFCNERRSSENENSYHTIGTDFNTKPIHDSQGQTAQSGNSEIVDWLERQEVSHNCIKDGFVSQNNASFEFSCENQEVHIHKKEHQEQLSATSQKQSTVATSDPVTVAQKGKLLLSASGNEKLAEQPIVIMQTSISKDSEDNHVHLSSFPSTNNGLLPRSSPVASPSPPPTPPPPPPLPPPQYIHLPLSSSVSRSNHSSNHLCSLPHREGCRAAAPPSIPSFSKKQSASELLASYLPPLPPIKVNSPMKSLSTTTLTHSSFTARKCDFELLASQLTFSPPMDFQHSVKCPMTGCLYSSTLHPVKKLNASNFTNVEISTPFNASHFYYVGSLPPSKSTLQASLSRNQIQGISSTPVAPLPLTFKQPRPKSPNCQQVLNFPSSTPPSSNPSSPSLIVTATPLPLSSTPGAISSPMQDYLTLSCKEVPSPSHEASQTPLLASPSFSSAANEGAGACLAPSFQSSLSCHTRKIPFTALPAATPTVPIPSTPCPFLEANTAPPPPPPPPIPPPTIGFPSTPVTEGCKRAPSLPLSLLGCHGQGSTPPSHGQTSSPPLPPLPSKGPLVAPSPPPPPTAPPPPHASTPSPLLASSRGPRSLPTLVGAPPPPSPPLLEGHRVAPSPLPRGFGEAPPLFLPPRGYDGPPSPSQPFPFGSSEILLEPHFPGGHGDAPPPPPPPPPPPSEHHGGAPPPPPPSPSEHHGGAPPPPPPPPSEHHGGAPPTPRGGVPPTPPLPMLPGVPSAPPPPPSSSLRGPLPPLGPMIGGRGLGFARAGVPATASKKSSLKPLHWVKVTRAMQGSLWAELQKHADAQSTTEFDIAEIETLFSAIVKKPDSCKTEGRKSFTKSDKVHLIDLRRANNTEIMLTKIKMPLHDMMNAALALDESILDSDQVENLIKFCPTKEDMELLKNYTGDKESLGKCEQLFLELMKVPRVEAKLRVFCFKIQFNSQTADIRKSLYTVDSACEEIRNSNKLKEIMKTILYIGNTLNQGTARGAAVGFRLDSLLKLADTRAANNKTTLMHYLCMVLDSRSPHLMHFHEDFISLEAASKIQLKALAEEQQGVVKGLAKVEKELIASESDGVVSEVFCKTLKDFTAIAGAEVRSLTALYTTVGKNADSLALYFGEDPARCPFEQVIITLLNFVRMFRRAHEENCKEAELEKKKALKTADTKGPKKCKFYKETC